MQICVYTIKQEKSSFGHFGFYVYICIYQSMGYYS